MLLHYEQMLRDPVEQFVYGGATIMALAVLLGLIAILVFIVSGKRLRKKLKKDYGEPNRYNM